MGNDRMLAHTKTGWRAFLRFHVWAGAHLCLRRNDTAKERPWNCDYLGASSEQGQLS